MSFFVSCVRKDELILKCQVDQWDIGNSFEGLKTVCKKQIILFPSKVSNDLSWKVMLDENFKYRSPINIKLVS